jgi:hypothetical protein
MFQLCSSERQNASLLAATICALLLTPGAFAQDKPEKQAPNMKYQIGWTTMQATTGEINKQASNGWKLRSATMTQCPTRDPSKTYPCVMIVMEKEDK